MNKKVAHSFKGMRQDISKSKFPNTFYFEGNQIRINSLNEQSETSVSNEKGNSLIVTIPTPILNFNLNRIEYTFNNLLKTLTYTTQTTVQPRCEIEKDYYISDNIYKTSVNQKIVGHSYIRDYFIIITTDNNGFDCVWKLNEHTFDLTLLYLRNLNLKIENPVQVLSNYETEELQKIYWVDGKQQLKFLNIEHSISNADFENLIDLPKNIINQVADFNFTQPKIIDFLSGGTHTAGMIQYAYNLYKKNYSQTRLSPVSELIPLSNFKGGGLVNEVINKSPVVKIDNLDKTFTNLKLYSIKYTSFNSLPEISLLLDTDITSSEEIIYYDDGRKIQNVSAEELLFLGADPLIPKHIVSKDNRLFLGNYKEQNYDLDIDCRAFSFNSSGQAVVADGFSENLTPINPFTVNRNNLNVLPEITHSSINTNYDIFKYANSNNIGGEGKFLRYFITRDNNKPDYVLKDREIYRIGIQFYNKKGQVTLPKWIGDFKVNLPVNNSFTILPNESNLNGKYAQLVVSLKPEFYNWLSDTSNFLDENGNFDESLRPIGYKILRAERNEADKTILFQGMLNSMMSNIASINQNTANNEKGVLDSGGPIAQNITEADNGVKLPSLLRRFDNYLCPMHRQNNYSRIDRSTPNHPNAKQAGGTYFGLIQGGTKEMVTVADSEDWITNTYQYNTMMQLFSPEILFRDISAVNNAKLNIVGYLSSSENKMWGRLANPEKVFFQEVKTYDSISPFDTKAINSNLQVLSGSLALSGGISCGANFPLNDSIFRYGLFSTFDPNRKHMTFAQMYRGYLGNYKGESANISYDFLDNPIITEKGQGLTTYAGDSRFRFTNTLEPLLTDGGNQSDCVASPLRGVNSWGARCLTFVLGANPNTAPKDRPNLNTIRQNSSIMQDDDMMISEVTINPNLIYVGNIYGGNSYESKKRTNYVEIGEYKNIIESVNFINNSGDTFVGNFKFLKLSKTDTEVFTDGLQLSEVLEFKVETSIDLKNRKDLSLLEWDSRWQPREEEYHEYNKVYSQQPNFFIRKDLNYNFKRLESFDTGIIATKLKNPGELIDSWTDTLTNEVLYLDGKHGPLTHLHYFNDEVYAFQNNALAFLSINPRIQTQGSDGIAIELGSGQILDRYKYLTTSSGCINKWSVISGKNGIYYYDLYNKSLMLFSEKIYDLFKEKDINHKIFEKLTFNDLSPNNPLLNQGISTGYDFRNKEVNFSFHTNENPFSLVYSEEDNEFTTFYNYCPTTYLSNGLTFLETEDNIKLYKKFDGNYNYFFDRYIPSSLILNVNPEPYGDCVFDNINYKSEVYTNNNIDVPNYTLTKIQAYNDYQDSGVVNLIPGRNSNIRRRFRDWNADIPRQGRNRIRAPWIKLKLIFDNLNNYKLILHDIIIAYTSIK